MSGRPGTEITLRHAEVLQDGELCTEPLRAAEATDRYTLRGGGAETWQPRFTFHGFRYAEVDGWPGELTAEDLKPSCCHTDMRRTGWFECSDERVNRLHENVVWGMRGNFLGVPDRLPPTRRAPRAGPATSRVFAPTATFLYDMRRRPRIVAARSRRRAARHQGVPWVVPDSLDWLLPAAVWGDAAVTVPSTVYERFGDLGHPARAVAEHAAPGSSSRSSWRATIASGPAASSSPTGSIRLLRAANAFDQDGQIPISSASAWC